MTKKRKKIVMIVVIVVVILVVIQMVLLGLLGGMGPLKGLQEMRMKRLPGNAEEYDFANLEENEYSPMKGETMFALGSSVTYGAASMEQAVGEYLCTRLGMNLVKEAVSGTTLVDSGSSSYVSRMKNNLDPDADCDVFLVQLSTNDATQKKDLGEISDSRNLEDFDTQTVIGAIEYIINYAHQTWDCPVVMYTGSYYDNDRYADMVDAALQLQDKYHYFFVIDLYTDEEFNDISDEDRKLYMNDDIHPTRAGYSQWWGPKMETQMILLYYNNFTALKLEGNGEEYDMANLTEMENSPLDGGTLFALGSSVTYGSGSMKQAVGEYLSARFGMDLVKEAVSGTTLVNQNDTSYVSRIANFDPNAQCDLFLCQLSTNDATAGLPLGSVSDSTNLEDFDTSTIMGAIEYIVTYAQSTWNCPVVFYTGSYYDSPEYAAMVDAVKGLSEKYDNFYVIDLFTPQEFNNITDEQRKLYMKDNIHPTRAGYMLWWGPEMERQLLGFLGQ